MADNIEIRVEDKASGSSDRIANSLKNLATVSNTADSSISRLKKTLNGLGANSGLAKLNAELNKMLPALATLQQALRASTTEAAKLALINAKLATEQSKAAAAAARVTQAQNQASAAAARLAAEQARVVLAQNQARAAAARLAAEQAKAAAAESRAAAEAARADAAIRRMAQAQDTASRSAGVLSGSLGDMAKRAAALVGFGFGAKEIVDAVNAYTALQNKLQIVSDSQNQVNELTARLGDVAIETRSDLEATVTSFARFDAALQSLGKSQEESLRLTETVNKLFVVGGATASEQAGALIQLSQAFNANVLQGEEYRSLAENMPKAVRTAIAEVLKINESALKKAASDGKITGQVLFEAFKKLDQFADSKFAKTIPTLGQAMNVFRTQAILALGELDKRLGVSSTIAQGIIFLGDHLKELAVIMAAVGTASVLAFGPQFIAMLAAARGAVLALTLAMASNPVGAVAVALAAAATYVALFGDEVSTSADGFITLKDTALGTVDVISDAFMSVYDVINDSINQAASGAADSFGGISLSATEVVNDIASVFETLVNYIIGSFNGAFFAIVEIFSATPDELLGIFNTAARGVLDIIESLVNSILGALNGLFSQLNSLGDKVGLGDMFADSLKVDLSSTKDLFKSTGDQYGADLVSGMKERVEKNYVGAMGEAIAGASQSRAVSRLIDGLASGNGSELRGSGKDTTGKQAAKTKKHKKTDLEKAMDSVLKDATGGLKEYNLQMQAANILLSQGKITQDEFNKVTLKATEAYLNASNPMREINKNLSDQEKLLNTTTSARETAQQMQQIENDLLSKGIVLNQQQSKALSDRIQKMQELKAVSGYMDQNYNQNKGAIQQLGYQQTANQNSLAGGDISLDQYQQKLADINVQMANLKLQMGDGTFADGMVASLGKVTESFDGVASGLTSSFGDFFQSFTQGFADSVGKAIVQGDSLSDSLNNVAQTVLSSLISSLIQLGIQYAINASLAAAFGTTTTAASIGMAAATSAAWATPAALVSLASFGANAAPATAGIASTVGFSSTLSAIGMTGFMTGGYTGNGAVDEVAGAVHGREYVMDAASTKAIGVDNLDALRSGAKSLTSNKGSASKSGGLGGMGNVNIEVQNNGTPQTYQAQTIDENTIRLIARDEASQEVKNNAGKAAASDLRNPNSKLSKGVTTNTTATRRR